MTSASRALPDDGTPFIILGADAVLAAMPASPVQLAHACQALGFHLAAPATWGDELIAETCLDELAEYQYPTAVLCSCPLVTQRLTRESTMLEPFMLTFASPPVATARYLRAAFSGEQLHITYAGACPGASDESIDARLTPSDLFDAFVENGIVLSEQPECFDSLVPLDRRRFFSLPGGVPAHGHVERVATRSLIEVTGDDAMLELTQLLIEETSALIDLATPLGCVCSGAGEHAHRGNRRTGLLSIEPPRARQRVLDQSLQVDVTRTLAELCELRAPAPEEAAPSIVHLAADEAPAMQSEADGVTIEPASAGESDAAPAVRRRTPLGRSPASIPRSANAEGEMVPRASLAVLRRILERSTQREASVLASREDARRARTSGIREEPERGVGRTPLSVAIASGADLPRPVPPPPARHRPRTMQEL